LIAFLGFALGSVDNGDTRQVIVAVSFSRGGAFFLAHSCRGVEWSLLVQKPYQEERRDEVVRCWRSCFILCVAGVDVDDQQKYRLSVTMIFSR
jgi:hypothetical protein